MTEEEKAMYDLLRAQAQQSGNQQQGRVCPDCKGFGYDPRYGVIAPCDTCRGYGTIEDNQTADNRQNDQQWKP